MAEFGPCPPRLADLKKRITASYPGFEIHATQAWGEVLAELEKATKEIASQGSQGIPDVKFADLHELGHDVIAEVRQKGCLVIRDVVEDAKARTWQEWLREYVSRDPGSIDGMPENDKQFFQLYWTKSQICARSHPNVLAATTWLNHMYHVKDGEGTHDVDLDTPLTYADRFRIRHPGVQWNAHPPHVDSGSIERWEDDVFRSCFADVFNGKWREHDPYDLHNRIYAKSSLYKPDQTSRVTVFRTFQGWLALSETAPSEGTLQVFPNVVLSNVYTILRPFFIPKEGSDLGSFDPNDWQFDISSPDFPGIYTYAGAFAGPRPSTSTHPHLRLDETMISVPKVYPGDMVFWHCDMIHAVEKHHTGKEDSAVMYIPAMPYTPANAAYVQQQKESFLNGIAPPDFPVNRGDSVGRAEDIEDAIGKRAMGFAIEVA